MDYKKLLKQAREGEHLKRFGLFREPFYVTNNPHDFVGRKEEQKQLIRYLVNMSQGLSDMIVLLGNHGIGKTAFLEYVYPGIEKIKKELGYSKSFYISGVSDFKDRFFPPETSEILLEARKSQKILLFIDDLDVIYEKYAQTIIDILDPHKFSVVCTWNSSAWKRIRAFKLPKADVINLENMSYEDCLEITKIRLNNSASNPKLAKELFSDKIINLIHGFSRGNPFIFITYEKRLFNYMITKDYLSCTDDVFNKFVEEDLLGRKFNPDKIKLLSHKEQEIFNFLIEKVEVTAEDISKEMNFTRESAVIYLKRLEKEGFVHAKRKGRRVWYYVPTDIIYTAGGELSKNSFS